MRVFRILNCPQVAMPAVPLIAALLLMLCGPSAQATGIYWTNQLASTIGRANLDGTGVNESFIKGAQAPCGIAVDAKHIYWTNFGAQSTGTTIGRANLDGTGSNEHFVSSANGPCRVAIG